MYLGDNLTKVFNENINANAVQVKPDDLDEILFENTEIPSGAVAISAWIDVRSDKEKTLFIRTTKNFAVYVQLTDDDTKQYWYDLCNSSGTAVNFTCNGENKAIPISAKGIYMRVLLKNNDTAADTPYVGVI